jgi:type IV pilus assembly protein PilW
MMRAPTSARAARGFSMVELMVAMTIGLIGVIIIFQVFETSEGVRRTTVSGGDAQQNGAIALYSLEHDLRNGGMGINDTAYAGCNVVGYDSSRSTPNFPTAGNTMVLAPVQIVLGGSGQTPDRLSVFYGSQNQIANSTTLVANMTSPTSPLVVQTRFGFRPGDLLLLNEPGSGKNCVFMEVTNLPGTPSNEVDHDATTYTLSAGASVPSRFNPTGGMGVTYAGVNSANVTRVFNLGNLHDDVNFPTSQNVTVPIYDTYSIVNNTLTVQNEFVVAGGVPAASAVADNIVHLRADYGLDDGVNDGSISYPTGATANDGIADRYVADVSAIPNWAQVVVAIRVAVVARSALPEKPTGGPGAACDTTTTAPTWSGNTSAARAFDLSADPNWKCYRYRVFETTVPLRNWLWKSS